MTIYTVLDESRGVRVFWSFPELIRFFGPSLNQHFGQRHNQVDETRVTVSSLREALDREQPVPLYDEDRSDWTYRVEAHVGIPPTEETHV
jgi:hypothetical protein